MVWSHEGHAHADPERLTAVRCERAVLVSQSGIRLRVLSPTLIKSDLPAIGLEVPHHGNGKTGVFGLRKSSASILGGGLLQINSFAEFESLFELFNSSIELFAIAASKEVVGLDDNDSNQLALCFSFF